MTEQELFEIKEKAFRAGYEQAAEDYTKALLEARKSFFEDVMRAAGNKMDESLATSVMEYMKPTKE